MSGRNLETLRKALDAFNRRDKDAFVALCDPEIENVPPRDWPERHLAKGPDAVWDFYVTNNEPWGDTPFEFGEPVVRPESIVVPTRAEMRGQASGARVVWSFWQVATFRDGKVLRVEWFADEAGGARGRRPAAGPRLTFLRACPRRTSSWSRSALEAWNRGDIDAGCRHAAEDVAWLEVSGRPESQGSEQVGRDRMRQGLESLFEAWDTYHLDVEQVHDVGDRVLAIVREVATGRASGVEIDGRWGYLMTVEDGEIVRVEAYRGRRHGPPGGGRRRVGT